MKLLFTLICFILSVNLFAESKPKWISDTTKEKQCKKKSLCAVGTGPSINFAKRDARAAIAKIFEAKIVSKFTSKLSNSGEEATEELEESTNAALSGVEIVKTYEGKTDVYALASINKSKAAKGFQNEIKNLDKKMKVLVEDSASSKSSRTLEKYYMQRELLNKRYEFLKGRSIPEEVTYDQVFQSKKALSNLIVHVYLDESEPKEIEGKLVALLSDSGMRVTTGQVRNRESTNIVTGSLVADKQYMKIEGFEKYKFVLKVAAKSLDRVETGNLTHTVITTGRNYSQNYDKALPQLKEFLNNSIDNLNIE